MGTITLDDDPDGLGTFPAGHRVVGRDDLGDVLAVDAKGRVWCFAHGTGDWTSARTLAFASVALLHEHVAFQRQLEPPSSDAGVDALRARATAIERFVKGREGAPYSRQAAAAALAELRERIADERFRDSKAGRALAACQAVGLQCERALREAGAAGQWICRAAAPDGTVLAVRGDFAAPWTAERVTALLRPLAGSRELKLVQWPAPSS
jgi:hypothetical protein